MRRASVGGDACPINVDSVDFIRLDEGDRPGASLALDQQSKLGASLRRRLLRVVDAGRSPVRLQHHGRDVALAALLPVPRQAATL